MYDLKYNAYYVSEITQSLGLDAPAVDFEILKPVDQFHLEDSAMVLLEARNLRQAPHILEELKQIDDLLIFTDDASLIQTKGHVIQLEDPVKAFSKVIKIFFIKPVKAKVSEAACVEKGAKLAEGVSVGPFSLIEYECKIEEGVYIYDRVSLLGKVQIGKQCCIKSGAVIGSTGFGYVDQDNLVNWQPHLGEVLIEDHVIIGCNSTIERSMYGQTRIASHCLIDDLVHIGENSSIEESVTIAAGAILGQGVTVGRKATLGPGVKIASRVRIGEGAMIGMGAVVLKDVPAHSKVVGNPAEKLGN